jgi:hypothetical protein
MIVSPVKGIVRHWVGRHIDRCAPKQDVEDWTQDLLLHLNCLPANSKHREAGKRDVVETFDPHKHYGASRARFFNYVNVCLANRFKTMRSGQMKNPICRPGNLSLTADWEDTDRSQADDEFCRGHSEHLKERFRRQERERDARQALAEFSDFVRRRDSTVLPVMEAIASTATPGRAAELLETTKADFCRMRSRLRQLGRWFLRDETLPRKRRRYRRRVAIRAEFKSCKTRLRGVPDSSVRITKIGKWSGVRI